MPPQWWCRRGGHGAYRIEFLSNTQLFPFKPAAYCQREHYTVVIHKKQPATVYVYQQSSAKLAVLTVASTPPIGEYGKQKVHYLTELSIENKRQHATQRGFDFVVAQNLAHGRTARWDKVMLLRRMLNPVPVGALGGSRHALHEHEARPYGLPGPAV